jgi:excisionase family DNA binding protein
MQSLRAKRVRRRPRFFFKEHNRMNEIFTQQEAADYLRVTVRTLRRWQQTNTGPEFSKAGKLIRYRKSKIDEWLDRTTATPNPTEVPRGIVAAPVAGNFKN